MFVFTTAIIWIDPVYVGEEDTSVEVVIHRSGYVGQATTVGKRVAH